MDFVYGKDYHNAKSFLDEGLKKDLRATHYQLGFTNQQNKSSHEENYIQLPLSKSGFNSELMSDLKKNHFDFKGEDKDEMNKRTMYMIDYCNSK